uniref:Uncharacterized protein n=1 Tax=Glossina austeni TaxID=7395 RepID=A0A1A9VPP5_GLOAU
MGKVGTSTFLLMAIYVITVQTMVVSPNFKKFYDILKPKVGKVGTEGTTYPDTTAGTVPAFSTTAVPTYPDTSRGTRSPLDLAERTTYPDTTAGTVPASSTTSLLLLAE